MLRKLFLHQIRGRQGKIVYHKTINFIIVEERRRVAKNPLNFEHRHKNHAAYNPCTVNNVKASKNIFPTF